MLVTNPKEFTGSINLNSIFEISEVTSNGKTYVGLKNFANLVKTDTRGRLVLQLVANQHLNKDVNSTHGIKVYLAGEAYKKLKEAFDGKTPFCGNLTDWAKKDKFEKGEKLEETYFRFEMYFNNLNGVKKSGDEKTLFIPVEENHLIKGEKGFYISFKGFPLKEIKEKTHLVKLSVPTEVYNSFTDEAKKALPIIADAVEQTSVKAPVIETMDDFTPVATTESDTF